MKELIFYVLVSIQNHQFTYSGPMTEDQCKELISRVQTIQKEGWIRYSQSELKCVSVGPREP